MATEAERRRWRAADDDPLNAQAAERYQHRQREMRRGEARSDDGPRPLEFDHSGFPIPQPSRRFSQRLGRLIHG
jgi:hypothetical protein